MAFEIIMPKLGVDMQEGEIIEWKKQEGDVVNEGDILLEIMSDKTNMELEAEDSGVLLKITRQAGETVPVTEVIGYIGAEGEVVADNAASAPVAEATAQLESAGLEVPKAPVQAAPAAAAEKTPLADNEYDIIVVGGGPAGYYSAIRGAQLGGKVAIVEKSEFGGTCLNKGCIPTKTYLKNAEILDGLKIAAGRGINLASTNYTIDMDKTVDFKNSVVKTLTGGVQGLLKANKVTIFNGLGQVNPDKTVTIGSETIKGRNIILATGSKVSRINIPGIESQLVMTSDDILDLRELPKSLAVMGGGVVGIELGLVYASYGVEVTVVEMADRIIPAMDKEVSLELQKILAKKGMKIMTSVGVSEIVEANNQLTLKLNNGEEIVADRALLSIGRVPQLDGLENLNLELDRGLSKLMLIKKHQSQESTHQVMLTELRCLLTLHTVWVKLQLKMLCVAMSVRLTLTTHQQLSTLTQKSQCVVLLKKMHVRNTVMFSLVNQASLVTDVPSLQTKHTVLLKSLQMRSTMKSLGFILLVQPQLN